MNIKQLRVLGQKHEKQILMEVVFCKAHGGERVKNPWEQAPQIFFTHSPPPPHREAIFHHNQKTTPSAKNNPSETDALTTISCVEQSL